MSYNPSLTRFLYQICFQKVFSLILGLLSEANFVLGSFGLTLISLGYKCNLVKGVEAFIQPLPDYS